MRSALLLAAVLAPGTAAACTVCFGGDARAVRGLTLGLYVLLGATFSIIAVLVAAVRRIEKDRQSLALEGKS